MRAGASEKHREEKKQKITSRKSFLPLFGERVAGHVGPERNNAKNAFRLAQAKNDTDIFDGVSTTCRE